MTCALRLAESKTISAPPRASATERVRVASANAVSRAARTLTISSPVRAVGTPRRRRIAMMQRARRSSVSDMPQKVRVRAGRKHGGLGVTETALRELRYGTADDIDCRAELSYSHILIFPYSHILKTSSLIQTVLANLIQQ